MGTSSSRPVLLVAHSLDAEQRVRDALATRATRVIALRSVDEAMGALSDERPILTLLWPEHISATLRPAWRALKVFSGETGAALLATGMPSLGAMEEALSAGVDEFLPEQSLADTLPQRVAVLEDPAVPRRHPPFRPRTVLLLDPDSMWRFRMGSILEGAGHRVIYASQRLELLEALQGLRGPTPDLCLLDPFGAGLEGLETVRALRAEPEGRRLPVLMASAQPRDPSLLEALRALEVHDLLDKSHAAFDAIVPILQDYVTLAVRRVAPRISFLTLCRYQPEQHEHWDVGLVYNLSSGGAFIRTLTPPAEGTRLTLELELEVGQTSRLKAEVAWTQPFERGSDRGNPAPGMGVHFEQLQLQGELRRQLEARLWSQPHLPESSAGAGEQGPSALPLP